MINTTETPSTKDRSGKPDAELGIPQPLTAGRRISKSRSSHQVDAKVVRDALRDVIDPEIGLNIIDLGLVYDIEVDGDVANVQMTLTSPSCPMGPYILSETKAAAETVDGVNHAEIILVWDPYWTEDRIDSRVRALMGY